MATYEYDAANRLIQMTRDGVVTSFGYSLDGDLAAIGYLAGTADGKLTYGDTQTSCTASMCVSISVGS